MDAQVTIAADDVQVAGKPRRWTYTAEYKRRLLKEADACTMPGAVGALLRREPTRREEPASAGHQLTHDRAPDRGQLGAWPSALMPIWFR